MNIRSQKSILHFYFLEETLYGKNNRTGDSKEQRNHKKNK